MNAHRQIGVGGEMLMRKVCSETASLVRQCISLDPVTRPTLEQVASTLGFADDADNEEGQSQQNEGLHIHNMMCFTSPTTLDLVDVTASPHLRHDSSFVTNFDHHTVERTSHSLTHSLASTPHFNSFFGEPIPVFITPKHDS
ncbi:hypothetical protein BLNAU_23611 [Blattamonas nauphoetae]|uniref:Uncharacterized protein n=1 Tax=Blattamonas nauphoetae TaxID=2049346 RepID=A0ABQ9WPN8_9EUKA|nr:hypothetical protein BLNAU_23611 [Blattamonas nauphoetae]